VKTLWIRKNLIVGVLLLAYVFAGLYVSLYPLYYASTAIVSFSPFAYDINDPSDIAAENIDSREMMKDEQSAVISEDALKKLSDRLHLQKNREYNPALKRKKLLNSFFEHSDGTLDAQIRFTLLDNIKVSSNGALEIHITSLSTSAKFAAELSNAVAKIYTETPSDHGRKKITTFAEIPLSPVYERFYKAFQIATICGALCGMVFALTLWPRSKDVSGKNDVR
jgi:uncharacterized protein involved in exopolysaccharide biosynthesis